VDDASAEKPQTDSHGKPDHGGEGEDDPRTKAREPYFEDKSEAAKGDAAQRCSVAIDRCDGAAAICSVVTSAGFVLFLMGFHEASACREDGRKSEKEPTNNRPVVLGDEAGNDAHGSAEDKAEDPLVRLDAFDGRDACAD